jgi:aspartyl-tRNA(Asn)/glutamyl-tRNA(Gln) amidotransferase subunit A
MIDQSIAQLAKALRERRISSAELCEHALQRIAERDAGLNTFITVDAAGARAAAAQADTLLASGQGGPLTGIPIAHKDIFCTRGVRTTCGSRMLHNFVPPYDATAVHALATAGAVSLGKTNMDEFAMGSSTETSYFGPCRNPWDTTRVPGGSSGGSAAAVAAGLAVAATGTDTGGSIRQPAALCGITGIKPTYGRVSRLGMVAFASSLDQGGAMARSAADCAHLLAAMAGHDAADSTSAQEPVEDYAAALETPLAGLRIGLPRPWFGVSLDPALGAVLQQALGEFERLGATLVDIDLPHIDRAIAAYYIIAPAEASTNLARYDGVRYGHRCENPRDLLDLYTRSRGEGFGEEVKRRILIGTYALSAGYYDAYYKKAQQVRRLIRQDFLDAFDTVDLIAGPTTPHTAFGLGEKTDDPVAMYLEDIYTLGVNLAGLPALSTPAGLIQGLPVGLQLVGPHFAEGRLLGAAHQFQQLTDWHTLHPPGFGPAAAEGA